MYKALVVDYFGVLTDSDADELLSFVKNLRERGIRTALLSNAESGRGVRDRFSLFFATQVFSGEVGLVKPDERVYQLVAKRLDVSLTECVFVDDSPSYVAGAISIGMTGIRHISTTETLAEITALFGV